MSHFSRWFKLVALAALPIFTLIVAAQEQIVTNGLIAFASDMDGDFEIYLLDAESQAIEQITANEFSDKEPQWSPDGTEIVFSSDRDGEMDVFTMNADGSNPINLTTGKGGISPKWSPDGRQIAFVRNNDIYIIEADGSDEQVLTSNGYIMDTWPDWSPDGQRLVFISDRNIEAHSALDLPNFETFVMNVDGSQPERIAGIRYYPDWSPYDDQILYTRHAYGGPMDIVSTVSLMDSGGHDIQEIAEFVGKSALHPSWSPDGGKIVFILEFQVAIMSLDGSDLITLTNIDPPTHVENPSWQPIIDNKS